MASLPEVPVDDTKIRIPGVHARWPWVLAGLLAAGAAGVYQADRSGRIRVLDYTDGWLTPAALRVDADLPLVRVAYEPPQDALGIFVMDPMLDANGVATVRAEPEPELNAELPEDLEGEPERAARQVRYRNFLRTRAPGVSDNPYDP
jgi:hypothetical protein